MYALTNRAAGVEEHSPNGYSIHRLFLHTHTLSVGDPAILPTLRDALGIARE